MIETQLYRQRLGIFSAGKHRSIKYFSNHAVNSDRNCKHDKHLGNYFLWVTVLVSLLVLWIAELNLHHLNVIITRCLKFSGDVELNPGPYEIIRSVQGSFNHGNVALFGETAGRQCPCNALFSICWSVVRDICNWKSIDLDYILVQGDKLCKSLKFRDWSLVPTSKNIWSYCKFRYIGRKSSW